MWLVPGLQVKRWFALILLGAVLMTLGVLILFDIKPVFYTMEFIRKVAKNLSTEWLAFAFVMIGSGVFFKGWQKTNLSMIDGGNNHSLLENLYRRRKLNRGPKVVAVGGGTGLSMLLRGIKNIQIMLLQLLLLVMMAEAQADCVKKWVFFLREIFEIVLQHWLMMKIWLLNYFNIDSKPVKVWKAIVLETCS